MLLLLLMLLLSSIIDGNKSFIVMVNYNLRNKTNKAKTKTSALWFAIHMAF